MPCLVAEGGTCFLANVDCSDLILFCSHVVFQSDYSDVPSPLVPMLEAFSQPRRQTLATAVCPFQHFHFSNAIVMYAILGHIPHYPCLLYTSPSPRD